MYEPKEMTEADLIVRLRDFLVFLKDHPGLSAGHILKHEASLLIDMIDAAKKESMPKPDED